MPTDQIVIQTRQLTKVFGSFSAVQSLDLMVRSGEIFGLIGTNGAGKSTLIKMLTTLLPPSTGTASIASFDIVEQASSVRAHIGYVPQLLSSDGNLTGYENLLMSARLYLIPRAVRKKKITEALERMDLADAGNRLVGQYSGGMIRRLEIAQAMLHEPAVLFLDEPTIGLDPVARHTVWNHLLDLRKQEGVTILMTTHQMDEAEALCDRIGIMHQGRLTVTGTPKALKDHMGKGATLDDVFAANTGSDSEQSGRINAVKQERESARTHG